VQQKGCFIALWDKKAVLLHCGTKIPFYCIAGQKGCFIALRDKKAFLLYSGMNLYSGTKRPLFVMWDKKSWDDMAMDEMSMDEMS
jgi:hypothetical protein